MATIKAEMPATVTIVRVAPGDTVARGAHLIILESMKMEFPVVAPFDGVVAQVLVETGDTIRVGTDLLVVDET